MAAGCFLAGALATSPASAQSDIVKSLDFNVDGVLPSADPEIEYFTGASISEGSVFSVSGGLLHQNTLSVTGTANYVFPDATLSGGGLDLCKRIVMETRLRILGINSGNGAFLDIHDGMNRYSAWFFDTNQVRLNDNTFVNLPDISQFHIYRVESLGNSSTYKFFVDDVLLSSSSSDPTSFNGFQWGDAGVSVGAAAVDWDFVRVSQSAQGGAVPAVAISFSSGPWRLNEFGGLEPFDIDGDTVIDEGALAGIALNHAQHYSYQIQITDSPGCGDPTGLLIQDAVSYQFSLDPEGEDHFDGLIDGICSDGLLCDGIIADPACPVTVTEPTDASQAISATLLIEPGALAASSSCTTTVFVATKQVSGGKGRGRKNATFEPVSCVTAVSASEILITDTVALNHGVKIFDGATNDLLSGPTGSIQLRPIGCP